MMMEAAGGILNVTGSNSDNAAIGPMPGSTPTKVPTRQPMKQYRRFSGVRTTPKPIAKFSNISAATSIRIPGNPWADESA